MRMHVEMGPAVHSNRATVVEVEATLENGEKILVTGDAIRHPTDRDDEELGIMLAHGRALERLGRKLQKRANGRVKHNDYIKDMKNRKKVNNKHNTKGFFSGRKLEN